MLYCCELRERFEDMCACCLSCHEDDEMGYEMCHATLDTGEVAYVCCYVACWLEEFRKIEECQ